MLKTAPQLRDVPPIAPSRCKSQDGVLEEEEEYQEEVDEMLFEIPHKSIATCSSITLDYSFDASVYNGTAASSSSAAVVHPSLRPSIDSVSLVKVEEPSQLVAPLPSTAADKKAAANTKAGNTRPNNDLLLSPSQRPPRMAVRKSTADTAMPEAHSAASPTTTDTTQKARGSPKAKRGLKKPTTKAISNSGDAASMKPQTDPKNYYTTTRGSGSDPPPQVPSRSDPSLILTGTNIDEAQCDPPRALDPPGETRASTSYVAQPPNNHCPSSLLLTSSSHHDSHNNYATTDNDDRNQEAEESSFFLPTTTAANLSAVMNIQIHDPIIERLQRAASPISSGTTTKPDITNSRPTTNHFNGQEEKIQITPRWEVVGQVIEPEGQQPQARSLSPLVVKSTTIPLTDATKKKPPATASPTLPPDAPPALPFHSDHDAAPCHAADDDVSQPCSSLASSSSSLDRVLWTRDPKTGKTYGPGQQPKHHPHEYHNHHKHKHHHHHHHKHHHDEKKQKKHHRHSTKHPEPNLPVEMAARARSPRNGAPQSPSPYPTHADDTQTAVTPPHALLLNPPRHVHHGNHKASKNVMADANRHHHNATPNSIPRTGVDRDHWMVPNSQRPNNHIVNGVTRGHNAAAAMDVDIDVDAVIVVAGNRHGHTAKLVHDEPHQQPQPQQITHIRTNHDAEMDLMELAGDATATQRQEERLARRQRKEELFEQQQRRYRILFGLTCAVLSGIVLIVALVVFLGGN